MNKKLSSTAVLLLGALALAGTVQNATAAGAIFGATGATIDAGGPGFGSIADTFNQAGLSAGYTSGVTSFDAYVPGTTHTSIFAGFEWFGNSGTTTATVTYDLGSVRSFDRLALWNEESSGIGLLDLWTSIDGTTFTSLASGLTPFDNPLADYLAEVFSVGATARYVRFDMSRCPQSDPGTFPACAIGEVAFRSSADVPEPAMLGLLGLGLVGLVGSRRRKAA